MKGFGFSLKGLLTAITLTAVGLTALFNASPVWVSVIGLVTTLLLLTVVLAAVYRRGKQRAFFVGCCIFGGGHLLLAYAPGDYDRIASHVYLLHELAKELLPEPAPQLRVIDGDFYQLVSNQQSGSAESRGQIEAVGKLLLAWLFGTVGGFAGRYFYVTREQSK